MTQTQMAAELGLSPSYLNLIESNQRPVTVRVLLKLAERFQVELSALAPEDDERLAASLAEVLSDPVFDGADVKTSDVHDLVATLPSIAHAMVDLYGAYRRRAAMGGTGAAGDDAADEDAPGLPSEEVTEFLQKRRNHFPRVEAAAEALWAEQGLSPHSLHQDLVGLLSRNFAVDVAIVPSEAMRGELRRYDLASRRLHLSEMLPPASRTFQLAHQLAYLQLRAEIESVVSSGKFLTPEADALARSALANYFAAALLMPYGRFLAAARQTRYDLNVLQHRFGVSFEQVCHRLTTLSRPGEEGIPFHLIRVDIAGNISKRFSASGIHIARFGAACPRWNVYDAFATPGMLRVQVSRMPDGQSYFCVARTVEPAGRATRRGALPHRIGQLSIGLGCAIAHARDIVYADGLNLDDPQIVTPIGVSCRTCPRDDCADRAMPSLNQRLELDENRRGLSTYMRPAR